MNVASTEITFPLDVPTYYQFEIFAYVVNYKDRVSDTSGSRMIVVKETLEPGQYLSYYIVDLQIDANIPDTDFYEFNIDPFVCTNNCNISYSIEATDGNFTADEVTISVDQTCADNTQNTNIDGETCSEMFASQDSITYRSYSECTSKDQPGDNDFSGLVHCCACGGGDFTVNTLTLRINVTTVRSYKFKINGTIDSKWGQIRDDDVLVGD